MWNGTHYTLLGALSSVWQIQGTGDFDGNGLTDILWRSIYGHNLIWPDGKANAPTPVAFLDNGWRVVGIGNFTLDLKSDILWRSVYGDNAIWPGGKGPGFWLNRLDNNWQVQGIGDFDRNGSSDILWRCRPQAPAARCGEAGAGSLAVWAFSDGNYGWTNFLGGLDFNWEIQGVGDFDQNHVSDIVWRCTPKAPSSSCGVVGAGTVAIWALSPLGSYQRTIWPGELDFNWEIHGVGDFDGNFSGDILWRCLPKNGATRCGNAAAGSNAIWQFANGEYGWTTWLGQLDRDWRVQGVGRFDR
jgi:hypothetical protein